MKHRAVIAGVVMLLTVLSAFAAMPMTQARAAAEQPGILYIAMQQDMADFNTWNLGSNSVWKSNVINWGFEGLAGLDYNMLPYPLLAESWDFDEDTLEVTIHLREGVVFHDGTPLTADDVVFMYHAARDGTTYSSNIINAFDIDGDGTCSQEEIEIGVVRVDDSTVVMTMAAPYGQFFTATLGLPILPKHIWEDHLTEEGTINVLWTDPTAVIGTAAFKYKEGIPNTYRIMEKNLDYWGKEFTTPAGYKTYPPNIDQIYYKIYASIDTAILALQAGDVDYIAWAVTAGRVPSLQADPNVGLEFLEDNGYRYLAFNMKFQPMGDINFRQAVSHLIDKDQIVNVYMGGFGSKGSAAEPPYWGEWMNQSIETYPYDDPLDTASSVPEDMLDDAGFVDANDDGWRDLPDGTPMEKIIILTPPADYDPIRIRAGQMIAKNMREVGINAEAKAIDFDTLVARLNSMDYQMLIIGWSLSSDPVGNVFDILGPKASSNTFGFWAEDDPNPWYADLQGVNTLADEETQDLAREVDRLAKLAKGNFSTEAQILYTKWGQGVLAEAMPCNVLYYQVNVLAYRATSWSGWIPWLGDIFGPGANIYSLSNLVKVGAGGAAGGAVASVNAGLTVPGKVAAGSVIDGSVVAIDNSGAPVSGATVALTVEGVAGGADTVVPSATSGTTDADGVWVFNLTGDSIGYSYVNVSVSSGDVTSTQSAAVSVVQEFPDTLFLSVKPAEAIIGAGDSTAVELYVMDGYGDPVEGATVSIDPNLVSYGAVDDETGTTDEYGFANTTYNAPAEPGLNTHYPVTLSYAVSKDGYTWSNTPAANILVFNDDPSDWIMTKVLDVDTTALSESDDTATITVLVVDDEGTPLTDHTLNVSYSDESAVVSPVWEVVTDGAGEADVTVQLGMADTGAIRVVITNNTVLNSMGATVTLTYVGATTPDPEIFGGYLTYSYGDPAADAAQYIYPLDHVNVTAHVWNSTGDPTNAVMAALAISSTDYGALVWSDDVNWDTGWDWLSAAISTTADDGSFGTTGLLNTPFDEDNWNTWGPNGEYWIAWEDMSVMTGVEIVDGEFTTSIYGVGVAHSDAISNMFVIPDAIGYFNDTTYMYQIDGQTALKSEFVIGRSYNAIAPSFDLTNPVMVSKATGFDSTLVLATATDETNTPIEGASVSVFQTASSMGALSATAYTVTPYLTQATDVDGNAVFTAIGIGRNDLVQPANMKADMYVSAKMEGYISISSQTQVFLYTTQTFVSLAPITDIRQIGDVLLVEATVADINGAPLAYVPVELSVASGTVASPTQTTNSDGVALFAVDTSSIVGAKAAFVAMQAKAAGAGFDLSLATAMVPMQNAPSTISAGYPMDGDEEVDGTNVTFTGSVFDTNGIQAIALTVDGETTVLEGDVGAATWDIEEVLGELDDGDHVIVVNATDMLGVSSESTIEFTSVTPSEGGVSMLLAILLGVGWIVAAVVAVMLLMKMKPKKEAPAAAEPETEAVEPEEKV